MKPYQICLITYKELDKLVREAASTIQDEEIEIYFIEGLREEILEKIKEKELEGAEIVIAGGANARVAKDFCELPVIEYMVTPFDYIKMIDKAFALGKRPVLVTFKAPMSEELSDYINSKNMVLDNLIYENSEELEENLLKGAYDVVIGSAYAIEMAHKLGIKGILIYPGINTIKNTIFEAKMMAKEIRRSKERSRLLEIMLDHSSVGYIVIDSEERIVEINSSARNLMSMERKNIKGLPIGEVLPECKVEEFIRSGLMEESSIIVVEEQKVLQNWIRIQRKRGEFMGAVGMMSSASSINKAQQDYRDREHQLRKERGFKAKNNFKDIIGKSYILKNAIEDAKFFSSSDANVLIYGETGVGKEIFAQSIHNSSRRKNGAFIAINCAALPENLLETELFGYDEGAFTGGRKGGKKGLFELAENGTLFLDEIGEISLTIQSRLLRVLQEKEIMHVGGDRVIPVNARIISATNKHLEEIGSDQFRRDLLYRLNVLELKIPPLRKREEDILILFELFFRQLSNLTNNDLKLTPEMKHIILTYSWPGNIRELQNICERFALYMEKDVRHTPNQLKRILVKAIGEDRLFKDILKKYNYSEKKISPEMVEAMRANLSYTLEQIGEKLGVSRSTLWRMNQKDTES